MFHFVQRAYAQKINPNNRKASTPKALHPPAKQPQCAQLTSVPLEIKGISYRGSKQKHGRLTKTDRQSEQVFFT